MTAWSKTGGVLVVIAAAVVSFTLLMLLTEDPAPHRPAVRRPQPAPAARSARTPTPTASVADAGPAERDETTSPDGKEPALVDPRLAARRRRKPPPPEAVDEPAPAPAPAPAGLQAVMTVRDTTPPPLSVITPRDRGYVMDKTVELQVRSEAGAWVSAEGNELPEQSPGVFVARLTLAPGPNDLRITASDAVGNQSQALVRINRIDPDRYGRFKDRLTYLMRQLDEIHRASLEIDVRMTAILRALRDARDADEVTRLSRQQRDVQRAKRSLQEEIEKAIMEIDMILSRRP